MIPFAVSQLFVPAIVSDFDAVSFVYSVGGGSYTLYHINALVTKWSYLSCFVIARLVLPVAIAAWKAMVRLHDEARDSRYLVGTELTNR